MDVDKYIEDILIEYNKTEFRIDELYKNYLELDFKILTNLGNKKNTYKSIQGSYDFLYKFFVEDAIMSYKNNAISSDDPKAAKSRQTCSRKHRKRPSRKDKEVIDFGNKN